MNKSQFPTIGRSFSVLEMKFLALLILILGVFGCGNSSCRCEENEHITHLNDSLQKVFIEPFGMPSNEYWEEYDEPLLQDGNGESYRLSVSFGYANYYKIYRIQNHNDRCLLVIKEYAMPRMSELRQEDSLLSSHSRNIEPHEWSEFKRQIDSLCLWTMLVWDNRNVLDGSNWILEGFDANGNDCTDTTSIFICRKSPVDPRFLALGDAFFRFEPLVVEEF